MAKHAEDIKVDKKDQLEKIEGVCLPDELIRAVFDLKGMGTGFLGITDKRIIFYDKAFLKNLTTSKLENMSFDILVLKPGEATRIEQDPAPSEGVTHEKVFFGTWGQMICIVDGKEYEIEKGKGIYFKSHIPHYCKNNSKRTATCVVAQSPRQ